MLRTELEESAVSLCGEKHRLQIRLLTERQIQELVLRRLSPAFSCAGRSDDGVRAGYEYAMRAHKERQAAAQQQRPQPGEIEGFFREIGVLAEGQRIDALYADLDEVEQRRQDAWRPKTTAPTPQAETRAARVDDISERLRDLEQQRQDAWRKPPAA